MCEGPKYCFQYNNKPRNLPKSVLFKHAGNVVYPRGKQTNKNTPPLPRNKKKTKKTPQNQKKPQKPPNTNNPPPLFSLNSVEET